MQMEQQQLKQQVKASRQNSTTSNPELVKLQKADILVSKETYDGLTDLSVDEINAFSVVYTVHDMLIRSGIAEGIVEIIGLIEKIMSLRRSRDRQGIKELVEILKDHPTINHFGTPMPQSPEAQQKKSWQFWKKN
jgi:hypothetical protein